MNETSNWILFCEFVGLLSQTKHKLHRSEISQKSTPTSLTAWTEQPQFNTLTSQPPYPHRLQYIPFCMLLYEFDSFREAAVLPSMDGSRML